MRELPPAPPLSTARILQMNVGFLGLQFSFGLQQSHMSPIYGVLGADVAALPLLTLAGPVTGLLVQPLVGALSDRTSGRWGRRTPYFVGGAVLCAAGLLAMPYSASLWMAVSLLWLLDAGNNMTMEPYRAYVRDRLPPGQQALGYLSQSAFTGLAQTLAYLTPSIFVWCGLSPHLLGANGIPRSTELAFLIGAALSLLTMVWSIRRVPELPLPAPARAALRARPRGWRATVGEVWDALRAMPRPMRQLAWMKLFQWYAMMCYWQYVVFVLARNLFATADPASAGFREAVLLNGQAGGFYNAVACLAAFALVPWTRRCGAGRVHALCLSAAGLGMLLLPHVQDRLQLLLPMLGIGLGWASMMGNPYVMLAQCVPAARTGVYMGIFNMFIVLPMLLQGLTLPLVYRSLLGGDPRHVLTLAGGLLLLAALACLRVRLCAPEPEAACASASN